LDYVSRDGKLFLLHDDTFDGPTDIKALFSGWEEESAENFTQAGISQLSAGKWFFEQDPFLAVSRGLFTPEQVVEYQQQDGNAG